MKIPHADTDHMSVTVPGALHKLFSPRTNPTRLIIFYDYPSSTDDDYEACGDHTICPCHTASN